MLLTEARAVLSATFLGSPSEISATLPAARLAFYVWCSVTSVCGEVQGSKVSHVTHILPESILSPSWARCLAGLLSSTALTGAAGIPHRWTLLVRLLFPAATKGAQTRYATADLGQNCF